MDVSVVEIIVYGIICYTGMIGVITSAFRETPSTKSQATTRSIWILPPIFCAFMLASVGGGSVFLESTTETITSDYEALNSSDVVVTLNSTDTNTTVNSITLLQPVWSLLHYLFFIVMTLYVIINILMIFTKRD